MSSSDSVVWCIFLGHKVQNMKKDFDTAIRMGKEIYDFFLSLFGYDGRFVRYILLKLNNLAE